MSGRAKAVVKRKRGSEGTFLLPRQGGGGGLGKEKNAPPSNIAEGKKVFTELRRLFASDRKKKKGKFEKGECIIGPPKKRHDITNLPKTGGERDVWS